MVLPTLKDAPRYTNLKLSAIAGCTDSQTVIDALDETLTFYGIKRNRPLAADNLLNVRSLNPDNWDFRDNRLQRLSSMVDHLNGQIGVRCLN